MKLERAGMLAGALLLLSLTPSEVPSCGPYFMRAVFDYESFPMSEASQLAAGKVSVIRQGWWRRFLLVAYRYMTEEPLTAAEQEVFRGEWQPEKLDGYARWAKARGRVQGMDEGPAIGMLRRVPGDDWQQFVNCNENTFATAAETLDLRIEEFGAGHPGVREWVEAQDAVLSNCESGAAMPEPASSGLPERLRQDRRYQIAAAKFYALRLHEAQSEFASIADDEASPWRDIAPYLVARCIIRRATLDPRPGHVDLDLLSRAAYELRQILGDESRRSIHPSAHRLLDFINARLQPGQRVAEVAEVISRPSGIEEFHRALTDFQLLMDQGAGSKPGAREADLVDWVVAFQENSPGSMEHALSRWEESGATVWLVAAISKAAGDHASGGELIEAASEVPAGSAAWATVTYHRVRLLMESGRGDDARQLLDDVLPVVDRSGPLSAVNLFREQRLSLARDLDEFLEFAPRRAVAYGPASTETWVARPDEEQPSLALDDDATQVLNRGLPLTLIEEAAETENLPAELRRDVAVMAWVRAVMLADWEQARRLADRLPEGAADIDDRFSAAHYLLRHPGLRPYLVSGTLMRPNAGEVDNLRDNWWCAFGQGGPLDAWPYMKAMNSKYPGEPQPSPSTLVPGYLNSQEREEFEREWAQLSALDTAPNWLAEVVVAYAREHPDDPRVPEALHLAVKSTRFGCTNAQTGRASQSAFGLLHRQYPNSEWTEKTPYWYK